MARSRRLLFVALALMLALPMTLLTVGCSHIDDDDATTDDDDLTTDDDDATDDCPADDSFEENDDLASAAAVTPGDHPGLTACQDDDDYYSVTAEAGDFITVSLTFLDDDADLDLEIQSAEGTTLDSSGSGTDNEFAFYEVSEAGTYIIYVEFFGEDDDVAGVTYDMRVSVGDPPPADPCATDDIYEPNDWQATAAAITVGSYADLKTCLGNDDYYAVELPVGDVQFLLTHTYAAGDLDLRVLDAEGNTLLNGTGLSGDDDELITPAIETAGTYWVRVNQFNDPDSDTAPGQDYSLTIAIQ